MRIFGSFCRDFLVPWDEITLTRGDRRVEYRSVTAGRRVVSEGEGHWK